MTLKLFLRIFIYDCTQLDIIDMSVQFGNPGGPTLTFGSPPPAPVYYGQPIYYHPPQPDRPATTGEIIFIGVIIFFFFLIFALAAIYGQPTMNNQPNIRQRFTQSKPPRSIPGNLKNKYPFGNQYDPALFSSGCNIDSQEWDIFV